MPLSSVGVEVQHALIGPSKHHRALMIVGESNCGKSFVLEPLLEIFSCFRKPPSGPGTSKLSGIEARECVFWDEFSLDESVIAVDDLLQWLEGKPFRVGKPKTFSVEDDTHNPKGQPVFFTGGMKLHGPTDRGRGGMVENRASYIQLSRPFSPGEIREIEACATCWARLIFPPEEDAYF